MRQQMQNSTNNEFQKDPGKIAICIEAAIGWLTFDNPKRHNALNHKMWTDLPQRIKSLEENSKVKVIVLQGAGDTAFSAGADISEFDIVRNDSNTAQVYEQDNVNAFDAIYHCKKPVVAMIHGSCFGGGFGIAAAADLRIASSNAVFCVPAAKLGLAYPVAAISNIVDCLGEQIAKELLFTARRFTATEMNARGFLIDCCTADKLLSNTTQLATTIAENAPLSILAAKQAINAAHNNQNATRFEQANKTSASTFESDDYREGRAAFKQRRKPVFTGT